MSNRAIALLSLSFAVFIATVAVARTIANREIAKIPASQRQEMTDFDWIGYEASAPVVGPLGSLGLLLASAGVVSGAVDYLKTTRRT